MSDTPVELSQPGLPGMLCPTCRVALVMSDRQGIEIDYCPKCRGVWLDRGELDKIIERSLVTAPVAPPPANPSDGGRGDAPARGGHGHDQDREGHGGGYGSHNRRRKSWLGELFD